MKQNHLKSTAEATSSIQHNHMTLEKPYIEEEKKKAATLNSDYDEIDEDLQQNTKQFEELGNKKISIKTPSKQQQQQNQIQKK